MTVAGRIWRSWMALNVGVNVGMHVPAGVVVVVTVLEQWTFVCIMAMSSFMGGSQPEGRGGHFQG